MVEIYRLKVKMRNNLTAQFIPKLNCIKQKNKEIVVLIGVSTIFV